MKRQQISNIVKPVLIIGFALFVFSSTRPVWGEDIPTEIRVGAHLPLTGILASIGRENKWAYERAVEDVNKSGGIYLSLYSRRLPVRLIILDDESSPSRTVAVVDQLIKKEKVHFILSGHSAAYGVIPGCIVAEHNNVYYHATGCFASNWLAHRFQSSTLLFVDMKQLASVPFEIWKSLPEDQRPRKAALMMADTFDGLALGGMFQKEAQTYGYDFILNESLPTQSDDCIADYTALIQKAKEKKVDAIIFFASTAESIAFVRQMKKNHFDVPYFHGFQGTWPADFGAILGKDAQYVVTDGHWSEDYKAPCAKALGERYYNDFKKHSVSIGVFYALAQILWQAIEKAGSLHPVLVRQAVLKNEFMTVLGKINYNLSGVGYYLSPAFQWIDGRQVLIYPFEIAQQKLKQAPQWKQRKR